MTTLLAHIRIKSGKLKKWEAIMADMAAQTFAHETGVVRYEYWKGQQENFYYCLLSFEDKWAFYRHQMSDYHEGHDFGDMLEDIRLEYLSPVEGSGGGLASTTDPKLADDMDELLQVAQERFPLDIAHWWAARN